MTDESPALTQRRYSRICRPDGAEFLFWFWFYKYAAPTALGMGSRKATG
jgi:hypothetical protein